MNQFLFHRDLDTQFLQKRFGRDLYTAREAMGSFLEMSEREIDLLKNALGLNKMPEFARILGRLMDGLQMVGLQKEMNELQQLRYAVAIEGSGEKVISDARILLDSIIDKTSLLRIEIQRIDQFLEKNA